MEGFKNIPTKVKQADKTYRQLMEIQTQVSLGCRTTISGPCCSFVAQEVSSTLVKTPRPDLTSQCSRIESIKNYRAFIQKIKPANLQAPPLDNLNLQQYLEILRSRLLSGHLNQRNIQNNFTQGFLRNERSTTDHLSIQPITLFLVVLSSQLMES